MESFSLPALIEEQLATARTAGSGRAARALYGGRSHALRQVLLVLLGGHELADHESPGEATLQVIRGRVRLATIDDSWDGIAGDYVAIPPERHSLTAMEDSAVLLTVVSPR